MSPKALANNIESVIIAAEEKLAKAITKTQSKLNRDLVSALKDLQLDREGYIKNNSFNRKLLSKSESIFDQSIKDSGYKNAVQKYLDTFSSVDELNNAYFSFISTAFKPNIAVMKSLQNQAILQIESSALNEGLISNVKNPLISILNKNINTSTSFADMLQEVREYLIGSKNEGKLLRYSRTWTTDALYGYSRAYQQAITIDLNLKYYYYSGGAIKKTRSFCMDRLDQYWSHKEIESWADLEWGGKNPLTNKSNIFILLGGYNCRHSLIPVSERIVPKEVLDRNR